VDETKRDDGQLRCALSEDRLRTVLLAPRLQARYAIPFPGKPPTLVPSNLHTLCT